MSFESRSIELNFKVPEISPPHRYRHTSDKQDFFGSRARLGARGYGKWRTVR